MNVLRRRCLLATISLLPGVRASAQSSQPVKIIVPYPAGGGPDIAMRQIGLRLADELKSVVIVDNKPGASTLIGAQAGINAPGDGHTLTFIASGLVTLQAMTRKIDILKQLKPVTQLGATPFVLVVPTESRIKSAQELLKAVHESPGKLTYGSAGSGSPAHMAIEYLAERMPRFNALHVPYKGAIESITALRGGQIDFSVLVLSAALPLIKNGQLKALAVTTASRLPSLPSVPTMMEAGVAGYTFETWFGIAMPASTDAILVQRTFAALKNTLNNREVVSQLQALGIEPSTSKSPADFAAFISAALVIEEKIVAKRGLRGSIN